MKLDKIEDLTSNDLRADLIKIKDSNKDIITDRTLKNRLYGVVETSLDAILMKMDLPKVYGKAVGLLPNKSNNEHIFWKHINKQYLKKEPIDYKKLFEAFSEADRKSPIIKSTEDITAAKMFYHHSTIQSSPRIKVAGTTVHMPTLNQNMLVNQMFSNKQHPLQQFPLNRNTQV